MPSLSTLEFLVGEAFGGISRNRLMSVAAVATAAITLAITAGFAVTLLSLHTATQKLPQEFDMAVYVKRNEPPEKVQELKATITKAPEVGRVEFVSKERGWKEFKKSVGADISMDDVVYNPALDSFKVSVKDPQLSAKLHARLKALPEIDSVLWRQNEVELFNKVTHVIAGAGVAVSAILVLGSAFIIGNTIRLGIYSRRIEIDIMRLIGARPSFIRLPFLLEGIILATIGGVLAALILRAVAQYISTLTLGLQSVTRFFDSGFSMLQIAVALVASAIALGVVSSLLSIRRYLSDNLQGEAVK